MNSSIIKYLVSPITRKPLVVSSEEQISTIDGTENYSVFNGIPFLQPIDHVSAWNHEILEILFGVDTRRIVRGITNLKGEFLENMKAYISNELGPAGVRECFEKYSKLPEEKRLCWYNELDEDDRYISIPVLTREAVENGYCYSQLQHGQERAETCRSMVNKWAGHLRTYSEAVVSGNPEIIVEFATGAGLGTFGLFEERLDGIRLVSVDIDYQAVKNLEGLAKYYSVTDLVDGVVANFWHLPFESGSIDVVCSHYGLDEAREVPRIMSEISRVIAPGGRFIGVSRTTPCIRLSHYLGHLGFSQEELMEMARIARLYPGIDGLVKLGEANGLHLDWTKEITPVTSHQRTIYRFSKDK